MAERTEKTERTEMTERTTKRVSVNLTKPYMDGVDKLLQEGVYFNRAELVKKALRMLFEHHGIKL